MAFFLLTFAASKVWLDPVVVTKVTTEVEALAVLELTGTGDARSCVSVKGPLTGCVAGKLLTLTPVETVTSGVFVTMTLM